MSWDFDYLWHFLGGFAIDAASSWPPALLGGPTWIGFPVVLALGLFGYARELWQHWDDPDRPRLTLHRHIEAAAWPLGGLVAALVALAF